MQVPHLHSEESWGGPWVCREPWTLSRHVPGRKRYSRMFFQSNLKILIGEVKKEQLLFLSPLIAVHPPPQGVRGEIQQEQRLR